MYYNSWKIIGSIIAVLLVIVGVVTYIDYSQTSRLQEGDNTALVRNAFPATSTKAASSTSTNPDMYLDASLRAMDTSGQKSDLTASYEDVDA